MTWEEAFLETLLHIVEANACRPWRELRRAMIDSGPSSGWPYTAWCRAKRKVLAGTAYGLPAGHDRKAGRVVQLTGRCRDCRRTQALCPYFAPPGEIPAAERLRCQYFKPKREARALPLLAGGAR